MDWIAIASGFGIGAIVGMTGVGGGSLMTPLLIGVFKLNPAVAIGTDLWFAAITKSGGAWAHQRHGHVDYKITGLMLAGSIPAAVATIGLMHFTGITKGWAHALTFSLGIALLVTAVVVAYRQAWQALGIRLERWLPERRRDAAGQQQAGDAVVHMPVAVVRPGAAALGDGGKPQVGADGHRRVQLEHADQERRHQRAAAHAGHADDGADAEAAGHCDPIHAHALPE